MELYLVSGSQEKELSDVLAQKDCSLVLSFHTIYELAKNFAGDLNGHTRGVQLFRSLQKFLDLAVPCSKEVMEFLKDECYAFENGLQQIDPMLTAKDRETLKAEVESLANGSVHTKVKEFIEQRRDFASSTRTGQLDHFKGRKEFKRQLKVPESELADWLVKELTTQPGTEILYRHLTRILGPGPTRAYVRDVLLSPVANVAVGVVKADLYFNWRCAHRCSNPKDLLDDMLHVLQGTYCDVYATAESKQTEYAGHLLTPKTKVEIYDQKTPVAQWLLSLA